MDSDIEYAKAAIDMLPDSVEDIRDFLRAQGVRGSKMTWARASTCPIAQWISKWTEYPAAVGLDRIETIYEQIPIPANVFRFIDEFDTGRIKV